MYIRVSVWVCCQGALCLRAVTTLSNKVHEWIISYGSEHPLMTHIRLASTSSENFVSRCFWVFNQMSGIGMNYRSPHNLSTFPIIVRLQCLFVTGCVCFAFHAGYVKMLWPWRCELGKPKRWKTWEQKFRMLGRPLRLRPPKHFKSKPS